MNWLEQLAEEQQCDYVINLGDFFDKPDLTSETITACKEIKWSSKMHYSIVGNHDASTSSLLFNSVNSFLGDVHSIITEPQLISLDDCFICFLPYIVECDRKPLSQYFEKLDELDKAKPRIILSHNDISGIQLGPIVSKTGFSIEEIEANCDLFINGHLHNGQKISPKVINLGNLTGKDFGEDATKYSHNAAILDTETLELTFIENPYAYNFYKVQINNEADLALLGSLKTRAVVSIKCDSSLIDKVKQKLEDLNEHIIESRLIIVKTYNESESSETSAELDLSVDHLARFVECCKANIESTTMLDEEITEICK
jgi:DNA repair exonuclease SbcCD nuclease subunit